MENVQHTTQTFKGVKFVLLGWRKSASANKVGALTVENLFFSRDESWMRFNQRVLEEAQDESNPVLERYWR